MSSLPRISLVTPSYNQAQFLEETISSVLEQGYPNLEYIVIDGASTDGSVDILRRHEDRIDYWISEPDNGQAHALAKGFERATGEIFGWLCSDDLLKPGALHLAAATFRLTSALTFMYGDSEYLYPDGSREIKPRVSYDYETMKYFNLVSQPSSFFSAAAYRACGKIDQTLRYAMDYDLFLRFGHQARAIYVPVVLSSYRMHSTSKSVSETKQMWEESRRVREKILGRPWRRTDRLRQRLYVGRLAWRYWVEHRVVKLGHDRTKIARGQT